MDNVYCDRNTHAVVIRRCIKKTKQKKHCNFNNNCCHMHGTSTAVFHLVGTKKNQDAGLRVSPPLIGHHIKTGRVK